MKRSGHWYVGLTRELRAQAEDLEGGGAIDVSRLVFLLDSGADAVDDLRVDVPPPVANSDKPKKKRAAAPAAPPVLPGLAAEPAAAAAAGCPKNGGKRHRYVVAANGRRICQHCAAHDPRQPAPAAAADRQATVSGAGS